MDKTVLRDLGLTNNEVEVYLTLLKQGAVTANTVAERSGLHRQAVYDALDRLMEKGFVSFVITNSKKHFQAIHPTRIVDFIQRKEENFKKILPDLLTITNTPDEDTSVEVFRGKGSIRSLYAHIINTFKNMKRGKEVLIAGADEKVLLKEDKTALEQHIRRLRALKCTERVLVREGDRTFVEGPQTTYRWVPKEAFSPTPFLVYGNSLATVVIGNPNYVIITTNKKVAEAYRKQFGALWKISKHVRKKTP
jgi:sugar-specific transcriptional regulator TrmB